MRALARQIYRVSTGGKLAADFGLRDQIRKASISIMANIAEGFGRGSKGEFSRFLWIAHASALETQSHLIGSFINYLSHDAKGKSNPKTRNRT